MRRAGQQDTTRPHARGDHRDRGDRGAVLVNALVMAAAVAAVAVALLARSERLTTEAGVAQRSAQLALYLDAFDAHARAILARDGATPGAADHGGEAWARDLPPVALDRGRVTGQISDLQGRFNLNWLANPTDGGAAEAFVRLTTRIGLPPAQTTAIMDWLSPEGPANLRAWATGPAPRAPRGGALFAVDQLRDMPGLTAAQYDRLAPLVAVLPADSRLNINTAAPEVLAALLPGIRPALIDTLVRERVTRPFLSVDEIEDRLVNRFGGEAVADLDLTRLSVGSEWFAFHATAVLEGQVARREGMIRRFGPPRGPALTLSRDHWE